MALFSRAPRPPAELLTALGPGSPPLAFADLAGGGWAVATTADWVIVIDGEVRRRAWIEADRAEWLSNPPALVMRWVDGVSHTIHLAKDDSRLPAAVRERVEASIVFAQQRELPGGVIVRAAVRRAADDSLSSQVTVIGAARSTPEIDRIGADLEAQVRSAVGLDG